MVNETTPLKKDTKTSNDSNKNNNNDRRNVRPPYLRQVSNMEANSRASSPSQSSRMNENMNNVEIPQSGIARPNKKNYFTYYIPAMTWIPHYQWNFLVGDIVAGLTIASYQIPIMMSYANMAFVPVVSGLYGLVVPPIIYAILGSVPQMIVGPEAPISMVVSQAMTPYIDNSKEKLNPSQVTSIIAGTSGGLLLMSGLLRMGFVDSVLSRSLLRGFISAVGVVMCLDQIAAQAGLTDKMHQVTETHPSTLGKLKFLWKYGNEFDPLTAKVAFTALFAMIGLRILKRKFVKVRFLRFLPDILIVVISSAMISDYFDLDEKGLQVVGKIKPEGINLEFPFSSSKFADLKKNFSASFFASVLGFFESIIAAKSLGSRFDVNVSTNRELVALGVQNLAGSIVSSLPSFGGYARSKVNAQSGANTPMSSVILSLTTICCILFAMPLFFYLPECVLSSVITVVGLSLLEEAPSEIKFFWKVGGYEDLLTLAATFFSTIFFSVQSGIAIGVLFSLLRVVYHATRPRIQILGRVPGTNLFRNADELPESLEAIAGCLIVKIPEPLTFANTGDLRNRLKRLELYGSMKIHPSYPRLLHEEMSNYIIMDLRGMTECDAAAVQILLEIIQGYYNRGCQVLFVRMPGGDSSIRKIFEKAGIYKFVVNCEFDSIHEALEYTDSNV